MTKKLLPLVLLVFAACNSTTNNQITQTLHRKDSIIIQTPIVDNSIDYATYCNTRYGYCIEYPKGMIYPQPESENGDGRVFKNKVGEKILIVFGRRNEKPEGGTISLEQQYDDDLHGAPEADANQDRVITYQKLGKDFFVISGYKKGRVFYQKTILKENAFAYALLEYAESEKDIFDKASVRLFKSFR